MCIIHIKIGNVWRNRHEFCIYRQHSSKFARLWYVNKEQWRIEIERRLRYATNRVASVMIASHGEPTLSLPMNITMSSALLLGPTLQAIIDEEKKGQTQFNLCLRTESSAKSKSDKDQVSKTKDRFIDELLKELDRQQL